MDSAILSFLFFIEAMRRIDDWLLSERLIYGNLIGNNSDNLIKPPNFGLLIRPHFRDSCRVSCLKWEGKRSLFYTFLHAKKEIGRYKKKTKKNLESAMELRPDWA